MSKILVVFGATGQQGGSVVNSVVNDPELSKEFKVRAITRDPESAASKKLAEKAEVVKGDVTDKASIEKALIGAHTVFLVTNPDFGLVPWGCLQALWTIPHCSTPHRLPCCKWNRKILSLKHRQLLRAIPRAR